jgi:uncharacterized protein (UPF0332 family)
VTANEKKRELALYRLQQAEESLEEARFLFEGQKSPRSVINRAYYAMYYSVLALLIFESYSSSKHSGVLSFFNKRFIKGNVIPQDVGRAINRAFDLRQRGDYREYVTLSRKQAEPFLIEARRFIDTVQSYLKAEGYI